MVEVDKLGQLIYTTIQNVEVDSDNDRESYAGHYCDAALE